MKLVKKMFIVIILGLSANVFAGLFEGIGDAVAGAGEVAGDVVSGAGQVAGDVVEGTTDVAGDIIAAPDRAFNDRYNDNDEFVIDEETAIIE